MPSDIETRNNHFFKDPAWAAPGITLLPHNKWAVKNNLEFKSGRRALVDGNVMENSWVSGQNGYAIVLTPRTHQSGLTAVVDDITISNNILKNMVSGFDTIAWDDACLPSGGCTNVGEAKRIGVYNNLLLLRDPKLPGGANNFGIIVMFDLTDFVFQHNTIIPPRGRAIATSRFSSTVGAIRAHTPAPIMSGFWIISFAASQPAMAAVRHRGSDQLYG